MIIYSLLYLHMNATRTLLLEANSRDSIKSQSTNPQDLTKSDRADWVNVYENVNLQPGDRLSMSSACIHRVGVDADTIEITGETVANKAYTDNSVIYEFSYYLNHNAINSVALPVVSSQNDTIPATNSTGKTHQGNTSGEFGKYYGNTLERILQDDSSPDAEYHGIRGLSSSNRLCMTDNARYTKLDKNFTPYKTGGEVVVLRSLNPEPVGRTVFNIGRADFLKLTANGSTGSTLLFNTGIFPNGTTFGTYEEDNNWNGDPTVDPTHYGPRTGDRKIYRITASAGASQAIVRGDVIQVTKNIASTITSIDETNVKLRTGFSSHVFNAGFEDPDNVANRMTLNFQETQNPVPSSPTGQRPLPNLSGLASGDIWDQTPMPLKTLRGVNAIPINANGIETVETPVVFPNINNAVPMTSADYRCNIYGQMLVKHPERWINGTLLNNCDCSLQNSLTTQYPLLVAQYQSGPERTTVYARNEPIFTTIKYTEANLKRVQAWLHNNKEYIGTLNAPTLAEALADATQWEVRCDVGRTDDNISDVGTALLNNDVAPGNARCPTEDERANSMGGCHSTAAGKGTLKVQALYDADWIENQVLSTTDIYNESFISPIYTGSSVALAEQYNIAFYPYNFFTNGASTFDECGYFVVSTANSQITELASYQYFGFSPSFYDNHAILPINRDFNIVSNAFPAPPSSGGQPNTLQSSFAAASSGQTVSPVPGVGNAIYPTMVNFIQIGAFNMAMDYSAALSRCAFKQLHTPRALGILDTPTNPGSIVAKVNERVTPWGMEVLANNKTGVVVAIAGQQPCQAVTGRHQSRLTSSGAYGAKPDWGITNIAYAPRNTLCDCNLNISDALCGVFLENVYFGRIAFTEQTRPITSVSDAKSVAVEASTDNWWGSLLWKLGFQEYEELFPPFSWHGRTKRFNPLTYGSRKKFNEGVKPFTTNSSFTMGNIQETNVMASNRFNIGRVTDFGDPDEVIEYPGSVLGRPNYQLSFPNLMPVTVTDVGTEDLLASRIIRRAENPYYKIYTDFGHPQFLSGDNQFINCMAVALKAYETNDFFYSFEPNYSVFVEKERPLSSIRTTIRDTRGRIADVNENCSVIYKIQRDFNIPVPLASAPSSPKDAELPLLRKIYRQMKENAKEEKKELKKPEIVKVDNTVKVKPVTKPLATPVAQLGPGTTTKPTTGTTG